MIDNGKRLNSITSALTFVGGYAAALVLTVLIGFLPDGDIKTWLGYLVMQIAFMLAILVLFRFDFKELALTLPIKRKISPLALLLTVPITVGVFMQNTILATGFVKLMSLMGVHASVNLPLPNNAANALMGILCVCIAPAIGEEFTYRGVMLGAYRDKGGAAAILLSALVFALGHFNLAQLVHQFILGVVLAYIVVASDNIWYAVAIHFMNNILALFLSLAPAYEALAVFDGKSALIMAIMCVAGVAILYPSLYGFVKLAGIEGVDKRDGWLLPIFRRKPHSESDLWARPTAETGERIKPDGWLIFFIVALAVISVASAILTAMGVN